MVRGGAQNRRKPGVPKGLRHRDVAWAFSQARSALGSTLTAQARQSRDLVDLTLQVSAELVAWSFAQLWTARTWRLWL
jgi:hypothetical protein